MTKKYTVVVRDECVYEMEVEASNENDAWRKAIDNIDSSGFADWQPTSKPQTTRLHVMEKKEKAA
jgi:hypothetical protein